MGKNIVAAERVLPSDGWCVADMCGRALTPEDLDRLIRLGLGDPRFTWERENQSEAYFRNLLQFRLEHYAKYGFGVHGVWRSESLIGQCGLQVLDEAQDQVELVVFLGGAYTRQGLGSMLTKFVVDRCRTVGMTSIYGLVRPENSEGIAMVKKAGGTPIGEIIHFKKPATVFRIRLTSEVE